MATAVIETAIRPLTGDDVEAYRALRLQALVDSPEAFSSSPEDESGLTPAELAARCAPPAPGVTFGAFHQGRLVGMASYIPNERMKTRHKATLVAVYLEPALRNIGIGRGLVEAVIAHARAQRVILHCVATMHNLPARRLYHSLGFVPYGVERDAILIDGQGFDEELLVLDLRRDLP